MAKIVITTSGTLGDHIPYFALAQRLQQRGHDILMVINKAMHPIAERAGIDAVAITDIERGREEAQENARAWNHWKNPVVEASRQPDEEPLSLETFTKQTQELISYVADADLLLSTSIRHYGLLAHLATDVPWITLSVNASAIDLPPKGSQREVAIHQHIAHYLPIRLTIDAVFQKLGIDKIVPDFHYNVLWSKHVILGSSEQFHKPNVDALQPFSSLNQTGFWFWDDPEWDDWEPSAELQQFCQRKPAILTFSSQPLENPQDILHKHLFAAQQANVPLIVQKGWSGFSAENLPDSIDPTNIFFLDYAPHDWLFARARCAIQHGGIGSLARAMRQSCPLIIEPFGNDQFFNAQRVTDLGVGMALHPFESTAEQIASALTHVSSSKPMRLRSKKIGRNLKAEDGVEQAASYVERYLARRVAKQSETSQLWWGIHPLTTPLPALPSLDEAGIAARIPKIIHHTWKSAEIPQSHKAWVESWHTHHPEWEFRLWTDDDCRQLIVDHYRWFLTVYDNYPQHIMRVDAVRYFIMYHVGGVYVDIDYEALRPIDPLLAEHSLVLTNEPPAHHHLYQENANRINRFIGNAFLASAPKHAFWPHVFKMLAAWQDAAGPLDATGPFLLSRAYESYVAHEQHKVHVESHHQLNPITAVEHWATMHPALKALVAREAYAIHHWFGSWWTEQVVSEQPAQNQLLINGEPGAGMLPISAEKLKSSQTAESARPLISCLMVTAGTRQLQAMLAILSFQKQTYANRELIIIDDGDEGFEAHLQTWLAANPDDNIRYFKLPSEGKSLGELRNIAVTRARGDYIAQWDDDDLSAPLRLQLQMNAIQLYGVDACLLLRQMIWTPESRQFAKSAQRLWEGSALLPKAKMPAYPLTRRGEDTPVVEQTLAQTRAVLLDLPELYLYIFHSNNTFDQTHWEQQFAAATMRYRPANYHDAIQTYQAYLGINLIKLNEYISGQPQPIKAAPPVTTMVPVPRSDLPDPATQPSVLILTPIKDAAAHLPTYFKNLDRLSYSAEKISIAFLEGDSRDDTYEQLRQAISGLTEKYAAAELFKEDLGYQFEGSRWEPSIQFARRSNIARSRNALLQQALKDEQWVLWIDADLYDWPADIIEQLLSARQRIVVPNCLKREGDEPFDLNTFKLAANAASLNWQQHIVDGLLQPPKGFGRHYLTELMQVDGDIVEVDSVGGTMLLIHADLHREGLVFPDAAYKNLIETEGLAAMAADRGERFYGLPNVIIRHS